MLPLFVYGTLLRGGRNHGLLLGADPIGSAVTAAGFGLLDLGPYPGMVQRSGGVGRVGGELYRAPSAVIERLDRFELHPSVFRRTAIGLDDPATAERAWAYLFVGPRGETVRSLAAGADGVIRWRAASPAPPAGDPG